PQPGSAVDPRPPAARARHLDPRPGERPQRVEVEVAPVVHPEVPVRLRPLLAACPAPAEHHSHHARYTGESTGHALDGRAHGGEAARRRRGRRRVPALLAALLAALNVPRTGGLATRPRCCRRITGSGTQSGKTGSSTTCEWCCRRTGRAGTSS